MLDFVMQVRANDLLAWLVASAGFGVVGTYWFWFAKERAWRARYRDLGNALDSAYDEVDRLHSDRHRLLTNKVYYLGEVQKIPVEDRRWEQRAALTEAV